MNSMSMSAAPVLEEADEIAEEPPPSSDAQRYGLPKVSVFRALFRLLVVVSVFSYFALLRLLGRLSGPVALRRAFEKLGPTYVKLGQLIASGEALFPPRYSEEFRALLDKVPPFSFEEVKTTIEEDLGSPIEDKFLSIDETPIAAASIAQVHGATLLDGTAAVVKVQRPNIGVIAATDVALMRGFSKVASKVSVHARRANLVAFIEDFENNLHEELDFGHEADRMREFNEVMAAMGTDSVAAPIVHPELSGPRLLTMERFVGWRLDDTESIMKSGYDPLERLRTGIRAWFQTLILRGFFHGDVHAGNFFLLEDGRIGYLDFGIVGTFSDQQKTHVLEYVLGFQSRDFERVAKSMLAMGTLDRPHEVDFTLFSADIEGAYAPLICPEEGFKLKDMVPNIVGVARKHQMRMPRDLILVTKQLVYLDRYTRALGGHDMNVLTDRVLSNMIMQDMFAAMFAR